MHSGGSSHPPRGASRKCALSRAARSEAAILKDWVRRQGRDEFVRRWRPLVDVRGGTPTVTLPPWDTRKTDARRTYKMLSNSAGNSLAITKQLLTI